MKLCMPAILMSAQFECQHSKLRQGDFREVDFTLKPKGKPVKGQLTILAKSIFFVDLSTDSPYFGIGLEEYRKSCRLLERAKKDTARQSRFPWMRQLCWQL